MPEDRVASALTSSSPRDGWYEASSARAAWSASGATSRSFGRSAAARWPRSARRSNRSTPRPSPASCRNGRTPCRPRRARALWPRRSSRSRERPIPASMLESDVLPGRVAGYRPADLDALCASRRDRVARRGRARTGRRPHRALLPGPAPVPGAAPPKPPTGGMHDALARHLAKRGASFWPDLVEAAGTADERVVLGALWDLVWAGEVTNDTLGPLRAMLSRRPRASPRRPAPARHAPPRGAAGRRGAVVARHSVAAARPVGDRAVARPRTSAPRSLRHPDPRSRARRGHTRRVRTVYGVLKAMEESGKVRRGYFVAGLGAAQFALPGAVDRLRDLREPPRRPDGRRSGRDRPRPAVRAALPWPEGAGRPSRTAGAPRSSDRASWPPSSNEEHGAC